MFLAEHLLHRSRRAELPHRALALGHDGEALESPGMADTRKREPAADVALESHPGRDTAVAASAHVPSTK